jgi:uncharacterized membrane protein
MLDSLQEPLTSFILGGAPISEIRGAAIYSFGVGNPALMLFGIAGNLLAAACLFLFWDFIRIDRIGLMIVGRRIGGMVERYRKNHELGETIALALFIGTPLPGTGVYSGILVGKLLGISNRKLAVASFFGIIMSASLMYLALSGLVSFLSFL